MEKLGNQTLFGYFADCGLFDDDVVEPDQSLSNPPAAWSVQDVAVAAGLDSPARTNGSSAVNQAPPATVPSGWRWDKGSRLSFGKAHEQGLYSHLFLDLGGEVETFRSGDGHEGSGSSSTASSRRHPFGDQEQTSSSDTDGNGDSDNKNLALLRGSAYGGPEVTSDVAQEVSFDRQWEGIVDLVSELTARIAECSTGCPEQQLQTKYALTSPSLELIGSSSETTDDPMEHLVRPPSEVVGLLSSIQKKVELMKMAVPGLANERHKFTFLLRKQAAAAAGAVKLISQLADAAVSIIPEMHQQLDQVSADSCQTLTDSSFENDQKSLLPFNLGAVTSLSPAEAIDQTLSSDAPTLDSIGDSAVVRAPAVDVAMSGDFADRCLMGSTKSAVADAGSDLGPEADDCLSLVADLLENVDRSPGVIKLKPSPPSALCGLDQLWSPDLRDGPSLLDSKQPATYCGSLGGQLGSLADASEEEVGNPGAGSSPAQEESDEGDGRGREHLPEGSYTLMEIDDEEILTEPTHCCNICFKEFKRDANLRMHMRSHGGKFKSSTALVRSARTPKPAQEMVGGKPTRYSCPYTGCSRNARHPKFQALKTLLCLKNHYRRSHCAKTLRCSICKAKQFSVVADLKTHEKHCGSDKWACSCGTTFSRKEKLYGHVSMFVGHVPVDPSVAMSVVMEVDVRSATSLQQALRQAQASDGPQTQPQRPESSALWQDWQNNSTAFVNKPLPN